MRMLDRECQQDAFRPFPGGTCQMLMVWLKYWERRGVVDGT